MPTLNARRRFIDVADGQVHYWEAGSGGLAPLVLLHASPGSARMLRPQLLLMAQRRRVLALDTRGNGDSSPLQMADCGIADFARATIEALDALGIRQFDLLGTHTGASIAMETAIAAPGRVRRLILESMGLWDAVRQAEHVAKNAPAVAPDMTGGQFNWAWHYCRDQHLFWPWYEHSAAARLPGGLPDAATLHEQVVEVLKALHSYHMSYRAAARHPKRERLPLIGTPTLVASPEDDPLSRYLDEMHRLVPGAERALLGSLATPEGLAAAADRYAEFLDRPGDG